MKKLLPFVALLLVPLALALPAAAAGAGRASAPIENVKPKRAETAWGRLTADAVRETAKADVALIPASVLEAGTLEQGPIDTAKIAALLAFPDDAVAQMQLTGAQLRAALERAASAYPTASPAMLHVSGIQARFAPGAAPGARLTSLQVNGREVTATASYSVAMPAALADGGAGYFAIWNGVPASRLKVSLRDSIAAYTTARGTVSPDGTPRFAPQ